MIFGNWIFGPKFGFLNIPRNTNYHFNVDELYNNNGKTINYRRDRYGFRGTYTDLSKIDILTIGGSTTNQLYIDERETWQAHLAAQFAADGKLITVINGAIDGQSTRGHIAIFDRWFSQLKNFRARYILAYVGVNDIHVEDAQLGDQMETENSTRRFRHLIINHSALYNLFRIVRGVLRAQKGKLIHGAERSVPDEWVKVQPFTTQVNPPPDYANRLQAYRSRLQVLIEKIKEFGARPIIVTQHASAYRIRDNAVYFPKNAPADLRQWSYPVVRSFNNVTMAVCREQEAICLDLAMDVIFNDADYYDHVHNTPAGTRKIGAYLFRKLKTVLN